MKNIRMIHMWNILDILSCFNDVVIFAKYAHDQYIRFVILDMRNFNIGMIRTLGILTSI